MPAYRPSARHAIATAVTCVALVVTWTGGSAQERRIDRQVERLKDEFDARVPPEALGRPVEAAASGDYRIDALLSGYQWNLTEVTYSFYEDDVFAGGYYGNETGVREVSEAVKTNVRAIMAWYSTLMNVNFVEVTETTSTIGRIRFMLSNAPSYAYAYYPSSTTLFSLSGDVHLNPNYDRLGDTNGFQHPAGEHGYTTLIHEIGHTVGLKHPHDGSPNLPAAEDNHTHTVMSYQFPGESPGTPMAYDAMALHHLYGARANRAGTDNYQFTRAAIDQYTLGGVVHLNPSLATKQIIWDTGGYNTLDLSGITAASGGYRLDLNPLGWLSANSSYQTTYLTAGTIIGPGVSIGTIVNSGGADTIYANGAPNVFGGYHPGRVTGADVIHGADSADTIDLSGYVPSGVTQTPSGSDLVIGLGANGSITVKGYYAGPPPAITFDPVPLQVSIGNVTVTEGNSGSTMASFAVSLTAASASPVSVDYSTAAGSAASGSDFVAASGLLIFAAGETQKTIAVAVLGDIAFEANEVFSVILTNPSADLAISDGQGDATILNDDVDPTTIMFVGGITMEPMTSASGGFARATVTVRRLDGQPVNSATVTGKWTGLVKGSVTGTTNAGGQVVFNSKAARRRGTVTFTVTGMTKAGSTYDAARNVETSDAVVIN